MRCNLRFPGAAPLDVLIFVLIRTLPAACSRSSQQPPQLSCRPSYPVTCTASCTLADTNRRATTQSDFAHGLARPSVPTHTVFRNKDKVWRNY